MKEPNSKKERLGQLLLDAGRLKSTDIDLIEHCQRKHGLLFGEAAVKLGLVVEADIWQVLAQQFDYPYLRPGEGELSAELVAAYRPFTPQTEALRSLRSQLMQSFFKQNHKQLALVGVGCGDASSILAANLAIVFSQFSQRTVLVDTNLREPRQHQLFNLAQSPGLSELLVGRTGIEAIYKIPLFPHLSVLPAGAMPPNPQELLGKPEFRLLMSELAKDYDITLLDTPDGLVYADTQNIVAEIGAALLVTQKHQTRISDVLALQAQIASAKADIVGAVFIE